MHEQYQAPLPVNSPALPEPFYYLHNFRAVLAWIGERYADLLDDQERAFIAAFAELPEASQALLVRMVMRKGTLFREGKLAYAEIGDTRAAVQPLLALGWVDAQPTLELAQLFGLLRKDELSQLFRDHLGRANLRKDALLERLQPLFPEARRLAEWQADFAEPVYELRCMALCDRLRLMYFGNLWQDWSEFVLADLGIYRYESVEFSADSRGFRLRADVDAYLHLFDCRQRFDLGEPLEELLAGLPGEPYANPWLEGRRVKLLFQFAQHCEKQRDFDLAQRLYRQSSHPGARLRAIRSLERGERFAEAHALAREASCAPESDAERQGLARLLPRLQGKLGLPRQARAAAPEIDRLDLCLAFPSEPCSVEWAVREHLEEPGCAVHYVENGLINSLFGLLCWEAIFAAIPGAFFHPFHSAPADLHSADFRQRR
ncbi:nuclease Fan1, partial [Pseudomonas aeruginosa]